MKSLTIVILLFFLATPAIACTCGFPGSVKDEIEKSDLVVTGNVLSKTWVKSEEGDYFEVKINLIQTYRGTFKSNTITIRTGPPSPACGFDFKVGKTYTIYAFSQDSKFTTSQCTRTTQTWRKERKKINAVLTRDC